VADEQRCARCGAILPPRRGERESCPRCLLALGLSTGFGSRDVAPGVSLSEDVAGDLPDSIGGFPILDLLGAGSRSVVYLAGQERRVALKVVRSELDPRQVLARFEAERPALDQVSHPGLAKVLDAGTAEDGRPWFAMEWVQGVPITEHCDRERFTVRQRLELLVEVCGAVQHAHAAGVIHRDIKPSNILVTEEEGSPRPKILDLGVARALDQRLTAEALYTARGLLSGTPCYVAPEHTEPEGPGSEVDARSDVYSLGMLLYELLAGAPPFDARRLRQAGWAEMMRTIREEAPPRPSTRVATLGGASASEVAVRRRTEPRRLVEELRDDLDWIALRALEKDPSRRYSSADGLGLDIQRHLRDEPVSAGPPGLGGRLARALRQAFHVPAWRGRG
jgi:serine/threonine protein kinase